MTTRCGALRAPPLPRSAVVIAILGAVLQTACGSGQSTTPDGAAAPSQSARPSIEAGGPPFVLALPAGWRLDEAVDDEEQTRHTWKSAHRGDLVSVSSFELPRGATGNPEAWLVAFLRGIELCTSAEGDMDTATMGGESAVRRTYQCGLTRYHDVVVAHEGRAFVVDVQSEDDGRASAALEQILSSFAFVD